MHIHVCTQLDVKRSLGLLIILQMSPCKMFLWMYQTLSWMMLEQQLQLLMCCSPLITLIIPAKRPVCTNLICTLAHTWCHCLHGKSWGPAGAGAHDLAPHCQPGIKGTTAVLLAGSV